MTSPKYVRISALILALLAIGGTSLWFAQKRGPGVTPSDERSDTSETKEPEPTPAKPAPEPSPRPDGHDRNRDQGDYSEYKPGDPSHAITPHHLRVYRENHFIHTIDNAILVKDYEAIRRMNAEYKKEFPKDGEAVQEAYEIIADCLEEKTPERVERARAFWEKRRSSIARRDIRKICLE